MHDVDPFAVKRAAVLLLHHHQRRVLRQRLGKERSALHIRAYHLVLPPLMTHFMRHNVEHHVPVVGVVQLVLKIQAAVLPPLPQLRPRGD